MVKSDRTAHDIICDRLTKKKMNWSLLDPNTENYKGRVENLRFYQTAFKQFHQKTQKASESHRYYKAG